MSNSPLTSYTLISPNKTSPRNHKIDTITIHCVVGQLDAKTICGCFISPERRASCNYGIGTDGEIGLCVDEADRSWCSSNAENDHRAITIECACDMTHPYAINDKVYKSLINLCADICKRNGIDALRWKADRTLIGNPEKQNMTVHRWFANKACPGDYIYERLGQIADEVNERLKIQNGTQAKSFAKLSEREVVEKVGPLFTADQKSSGILASVSLAQFILESGYGKTELAQNANNCFGMKTSLSGNTWKSSTWDGKSKYIKLTKEWDGSKYITISADFRKYATVEESITDHSAYLLGAMNGSKKRYAGLKGCTDYRKAIQIIKDGGYATDPKYVDRICDIILRWNLTKYDMKVNIPEGEFFVKILVPDLNFRSAPSMDGKINGQTGKGIFTIIDVQNGWGKLKSGAGWIWLMNPDYCTIIKTPFMVRVSIPDLNIRTGPGTNYVRTGEYTGIGSFTIIDVKTGKGSNTLWGCLKSGAGWISLDYATLV